MANINATLLLATFLIASGEPTSQLSTKVLVVSYEAVATFHSHFMESLAVFLEQHYDVGFLCKDKTAIKNEYLKSSSNVEFVHYSTTLQSDQLDELEVIGGGDKSPLALMRRVKALTERSTRERFSEPYLLQDIKFKNYSLVIYNSMDYGMAAFCHHLNISCIKVITSGTGSVQNPLNLEFMNTVPFMLTDFIDLSGITSRFQNTLYYLLEHYLRLYYFYPGIEKIAKEFGYIQQLETQSYWQIAANTPRATLIYTNNAVDCHIPLPQSYVRIGGALLSTVGLNSEYQSLMDRSTDGVVVVAFGRGDNALSDEFSLLLLSAFSELNQTVIWSVGKKPADFHRLGVPSNVIISESIPQNSLLAHRNCKLLVTRGGLGSTVEAVYHGVPTLVLPFFADQTINARRLKEVLKMGEILPKNSLTQEKIINSIRDMMANPEYTSNARLASTKFHRCTSGNVDNKLLDTINKAVNSLDVSSSDRTKHWVNVVSTDILIVFIVLLLLFATFLLFLGVLFKNKCFSIVNDMKKMN